MFSETNYTIPFMEIVVCPQYYWLHARKKNPFKDYFSSSFPVDEPIANFIQHVGLRATASREKG